jgi:hypothetical protein
MLALKTTSTLSIIKMRILNTWINGIFKLGINLTTNFYRMTRIISFHIMKVTTDRPKLDKAIAITMSMNLVWVMIRYLAILWNTGMFASGIDGTRVATINIALFLIV